MSLNHLKEDVYGPIIGALFGGNDPLLAFYLVTLFVNIKALSVRNQPTHDTRAG